MQRQRIIAIVLILLGLFLGYFDYASERGTQFAQFPFALGLDLSGGTHLVYDADLSRVIRGEERESLDALRDVIERRVNIFGVSEPLVQVERSIGQDGEQEGRLIVELPGVTDVDEAVSLIGATPVLEFKVERRDIDQDALEFDELTGQVLLDGVVLGPNDIYVETSLTGKNLRRAQLQFNNVSGEPIVALDFDGEGSDLFRELTRDNIGRTIAIYLDGVPITTPVVQNEITGGQAQITGNFTNEEARTLVGRLNAGALPVPISLLSTQTVGSILGADAIESGVRAGLYGFMLVALFFVLWYRLPGLFAVISLLFYVAVLFAIFKLIPVTLTAAGIAGFILSIGLAVDANVLIFERLKEEFARGKQKEDALTEAFARAWLSIRDANISSILTAIILFWFGTSLIKGFALTFGLGVAVSMFSAIVFTKALMFSFIPSSMARKEHSLMKAGFKK